MSSHHIVRDEQEPALIIHGMQGFPFERLGSMLEWSPTVICCEPAIQAILDLGIKVDIVVLKSDQDYGQLLMDQAPVKILTIGNGDHIGSSLQLLLNSKHQAANIITSSDQVESVMDSVMGFVNQMDLTVWDIARQHILVRKFNYRKWLPEGVSFRVTGLLEKSEGKIQEGEKRTPFNAFDSVEIVKEEDGFIEIQYSHPPFVLVIAN